MNQRTMNLDTKPRTHDDGIRCKPRIPGALDFPTKSALVLSAVTLAGLLLLSAMYSEPASSSSTTTEHNDYYSYSSAQQTHRALEGDDTNNTDYSSHSCNYIYEVTPDAGEAQCNFARTCNQGAGVWAPSVFCSDRFSRMFLCIILSPFMLLWLVLLFRLLGSTAEDYFSPALEMFSVKLGLPPRFAGVTLLALGNGAADVSATISSITSDPVAGYKMSLGALTGAAMVISGVISAAVILAADGVPCRGALVRDVAALVVTVVTVWSQLATGKMGPEAVSLFLSLYTIFVLLVLTADIYHRAMVLPRMAVQAGDAELQRQLEAANEIPAVPATPESRFSSVLSALSNYDTVDEDSQAPGSGWGVESEDLAHDRPIQLHGQGGILGRPSHVHSTPSSIEQDPDNSYAVLEDAVDHACVQTGSFGIPADSWKEAVADGQDELVQHAATVWDDIMYDGDVHPISRFLLLCELPFTIVRQVTVPIPCEGFYCRALVALSLAVSPLWFVYYLWSGHDFNMLAGGRWPFFLILELAVCAFALCILRFAPSGNGEMALAFATPIALYGFVIAATWIDTIADALVSLLNFIGIILRIPGPVIGLTILAWGNSMGDLSANMTMARKGLANMAMTACFAGPVFNILVGLGLGFSSLAAQTGKAETEVSLSPSVVTGFVFIAVNAVALLGTGLVFGKGHIPYQFGYLALVVYTIYLVTSISLQYSKFGDS
jgi:solute carrier family 24 (sodium/potassium/calcium exchanger), member 6